MRQCRFALALTLLALAACGNVPVAPAPTSVLPAPTIARAASTPTSAAPAPITALISTPTSTPPSPIPAETAASSKTAGVPSIEQIDQLPVVYALPGMENVRVQKDLTYKEIEGQKLQLDVYVPAGIPGTARLPAVLFVHGDPVRPGQNVKNARPFVSWGQLLAASGMIAITFNWRVRTEPADVAEAIQYVRQHADTLQINPDRLGVFAFSAGAAATLNPILAGDGSPEYLRCLVVYYGDLTLPLNRVFALEKATTAHFAPILLVKGGKDENVSPELIDMFVQQATTKGIQVELLVHPTGVHGFDVLNDDDQSREIIKKTIAFLQAHLLAP